MTKADMTGEVRMTDCEPKQLQVVAERLINMIIEMTTRLDYQFPNYNTMTELDKILIVEYWKKYDDLDVGIAIAGNEVYTFNMKWFFKATEPELIRRARQILLARHWIFVKDEVKERADNAGNNFKAVKQR